MDITVDEEYRGWLEANRPHIKLTSGCAAEHSPVTSYTQWCLHKCEGGWQTWWEMPFRVKQGATCGSSSCFQCHRDAPVRDDLGWWKWLKVWGNGINTLDSKSAVEDFCAQWESQHGEEAPWKWGEWRGSTFQIPHRCSKGHTFIESPSKLKKNTTCPICHPELWRHGGGKKDNDAVYLWEWVEDGKGTGIYKPGLTSWRLADKRIRDCARDNGIDYRLIALCQTSEKDAKAFESVLLGMGDEVVLPNHIVDGRTEFRIYSEGELALIYQLLGVEGALAEAA